MIFLGWQEILVLIISPTVFSEKLQSDVAAKSYFEEITGRTVSRMKRGMALLYSRLEVVKTFWVPLRKGIKRERGQRRARRILKGLNIFAYYMVAVRMEAI